MADRLTQLQDCLDQLATQLYASIRYIQTYHSYGAIDGQADQNPWRQDAAMNNAAGEDGADGVAGAGSSQLVTAEKMGEPGPFNPKPEDPKDFDAAMHELARDLVLKEQQIEYLIRVLPGIGNSEQDQFEKIRELEEQLQKVEVERSDAMKQKEELQRDLDSIIMKVRRI